MKLSECSKGRLVRLSSLSYDGALLSLNYGHIEGIDKDNKVVLTRILGKIPTTTVVGRYPPEDLKPLED